MSRIAGILLAAGRGTRFGGDKLNADLAGLPLAHHAARTLATIPLGWHFAVIPGDQAPPGFHGIRNDDPCAGQARSLVLAIFAARQAGADAALIALADMPCVSARHLRRIVDGYDGPSSLVASTDGAKRLPPVLFGRDWFPRLESVAGDQGARDLLADAALVHASQAELIDVDTPHDLTLALRCVAQRG